MKGLGPDALDQTELTPGETIAHDRGWAIENGRSGFDPEAPEHLPKIKFLMLMKNERLAALQTRFEEETRTLTIFRHGKRVAGGRLDDPLGRQILEQFFAGYMAGELRGAPKILRAEDFSFSDVPAKVVSIINQASLTDLERVTHAPVDPDRFRANLLIEGLKPWAEFVLVGQEIGIGEARLKVIEPIQRCAAVNVDPQTGARDMQIPRLLDQNFGHQDFGVYAEVVEGGTVRVGDRVEMAGE
ncbi:MOSC domain protein [Lutibaculum baratangense AMV1]|uniref:MOSC domain protein n=1 Tax=Lutibaculum baratangense AMV1 TaxID=631454 RepID=V4RD46_9HYPH|nr:MOSC domain protein [Lutibaculum baratangense AMV1]